MNNCSKAEYNKHSTLAFVEYHARSRYKWEPDFGEYAGLVEKEIQLKIAEAKNKER